MMIRLIGISAVLFVTGCTSIGTSEFGCSGIPEATTCMAPEEVYNATNSATPIYDNRVSAGSDGVKDSSEQRLPPRTLGHVGYQLPPTPLPMPVRTSAKVMRMWIAPWEDRSGDLHMPNYVFSEIEIRRWNLGEDAVKSRSNQATPLKTFNHSRKEKNL